MTDLERLAKALTERIDFDNNGVVVGHVRQGGNGGLCSIATIRANEAVKRELARLEAEQRGEVA